MQIQACFPNRHIWIGAADNVVEGLFVWSSDGANVSQGYTNWANDEPSDSYPGEDCMSKRRGLVNKKWNDKACESELFVLCETA